MLKSWQGCFAVTAFVFLLQVIPYTGVFLMMLAAPLWSVVLINLGFVLMAHDAWRDPGQRYLMILPALWFGGYLLVSAVSHWQAHSLEASILKVNRDKHVAFDQQSQDLVIQIGRDEYSGSPLRAGDLIRSYNLYRAFEQREADFRKPWLPPVFRHAELVGYRCPSPRDRNRQRGVSWGRLYDKPAGQLFSDIYAVELCLMETATAPDRPVVRVASQPQVESTGLTNRITQTIIVTGADGKSVELSAGRAQPISWLPKPILGCTLISSTPSWKCFASFQRDGSYALGRDRASGATAVVASALGLGKASVRQRYPNVGWASRRDQWKKEAAARRRGEEGRR